MDNRFGSQRTSYPSADEICKVYFGKTRNVVFDLRSVESLEKARRQRDLQKELVGMMNKNKSP